MRTGLHHVSSPTCGPVFHFSVWVCFHFSSYWQTGTLPLFMFICKCFNAFVSSVNIQSSIWLGPSRECPAWIDSALQAARGSHLPEASSPPTATWAPRVCASYTDTGQSVTHTQTYTGTSGTAAQTFTTQIVLQPKTDNEMCGEALKFSLLRHALGERWPSHKNFFSANGKSRSQLELQPYLATQAHKMGVLYIKTLSRAILLL